jgi:hypothetical protein
MRFIEVRTIDNATIVVNPSMIASIEPSSRPYSDETDLHFLQRKITIKVPYKRAVELLSATSDEQ